MEIQKNEYQLTIEDVFTPGAFPKYNYHSRKSAEEQFINWRKSRGSVLVVYGPSKTGKTVLLEKLIEDEDPIWVDGGGITSVSVFWDRVTDALGGFTVVQRIVSSSESSGTAISGRAGIAGNGVGSEINSSQGTDIGETMSVDRPTSSVVRDALKRIDRPLVIDDIHFVSAEVQKDIIKAVKPLVFGTGTDDKRGRSVIMVSIGNRVQQVISSLPDMRGRIELLEMQYWNTSDLETIAIDGFERLGLSDPSRAVVKKLARNSFGSPQLMQQLCRAICRDENNTIRDEGVGTVDINPPSKWEEFFRDQLMDEMGLWVDKLAEGPAVRGSARKERELQIGGRADGYKLTLLALSETGPLLTASKTQIEDAIQSICIPQEGGVRVGAPVSIMKNMSLIAATNLEEKIPPLEKLRQQREQGFDPYAQADLQPVLEYVDRGPLSEMRITEPYFAFYLAWGVDRIVNRISSDVEMEVAADDWGE